MAEASSGTIIATNEYRNVELRWSITQDIATNTSTMSIALYGGSNGSSGYYEAGPFNVWVNGTQVITNLYSNSFRWFLRSGVIVDGSSTSITIPHEADGSKSVAIRIEAAVYTYAINSSIATTVDLTSIARASSITTTTLAIGATRTISISRNSSTFYHTVRCVYGSYSENLTSGGRVGASCSWNLASNDIYSLMANVGTGASDYLTVNVYLQTYSAATGGTKIGDEEMFSIKLTVPSYTLSTPTISVSDVDGMLSGSYYLQNASHVGISVSGTSSKYGSPLIYTYTVGSDSAVSSSSNTYTSSSEISDTGSVTVSVSVTDSRSTTTPVSASTSITVLSYEPPALTAKTARVVSGSSDSLTVTVGATANSVKTGSTERNTSFKVYALYSTVIWSDSSYPSISSTYLVSSTFTTADGIHTIAETSKTYSNGIDSTSTYYIRFVAVDSFMTTYFDYRISAGSASGVIMDIQRSKKFGFGKYNEHGTVDIQGDTYVNNTSTVSSPNGSLYLNGVSNPGWIYFRNDTVNSITGGIYLQHSSGLPVKYFFRQFSSANGALSSYSETYNLPEVTAELTANATYTILTDKDPAAARSLLGLGPVQLYGNTTGITTGGTTLSQAQKYTYFIILGKASTSDTAYMAMVVPSMLISTTSSARTQLKFADSSNTNLFEMYINANTAGTGNGSIRKGTTAGINTVGSINYVYGVI